MNVILEENQKIPIFSWCEPIEENALKQMKVISNLPFVTHCALMPDAHMGNSMPIGGVVACDGVIVPNFVGVDIGCGMCAIKTTLKASDLILEKMQSLHHRFERSIPTGFNHNDDNRYNKLITEYGSKFLGKTSVVAKDTPAFIGNRIGLFRIQRLFHLVKELVLTI
jgi:RNA-splicing ligase RtcB